MTLKLEVGKSYKRRGGTLTRITKTTESVVYPYTDEEGFTYREDGVYWHSENPHKWDIVEEVKTQVTTRSPVRTVTRKEVVPGVYGNVKAYINGAGKIGAQATCLDKDNIREAIATLTLIADALENGDEATS